MLRTNFEEQKNFWRELLVTFVSGRILLLEVLQIISFKSITIEY